MKENYAGIDYGRGISNIDQATGIRYGVIAHHKVGQSWYDDSEPYYVYVCPKCEVEFKNELPESGKCSCGYWFNDEDFGDLEPVSWYVDDGEYMAECGQDDVDIFITKSPYFTYAQFCSPCAPGAGYLMTPYVNRFEKDGKSGIKLPTANSYLDYKEKAEAAGFPKVYCFGHDWFYPPVAPYPVFSVETGEIVLPPEE